MRTPLELLRAWIRRQARQELDATFGEASATAQKEMQRLARVWPADSVLLSDEHARPGLGADTVILEHRFQKITLLGGYIDATSLVEGEQCRVKVLVAVGDKRGLTPLYNRVYSGPMEDCILMLEQPVLGRVKIIYQQAIGKPRTVHYRFFGRR